MGTKHEGGLFEHRTRYIILLLGWICLTSIFSNTIALNFTFICMTKPASKNQTENDVVGSNYFAGELNYEQSEKSALLWALGFGTFVGVWPFNFLYLQYGARYVFFAAGFLSAFSTLVIPLTAYMGLIWFIAARVLQGVAYGADFAAIGVITVRWASLKQSGVFIAVLTSFNSLSTLITNPISGLLCESSLGWPAVYYIHAAFGIFIFTVWILFYRDQPETHKNVSGIELEKIRREKSEGYISSEKYVPYLAIIKNPAILIIWFNAFVEIVSALFLLSYGPTYIKYVLNISIEGTGFLVALQGLSFLPFRIAAGFMSDQIKCMNEYQKMIFFNTLSLVGAGVFYCILGFIPPEKTSLSVFAIAVTHAVMAFNVGGFYKCGTFVARQHSHFVISNIQFIKCVALFVSPLLVAIFVTDDSAQEQWRIIFIILAISLLVANFAFCLIATDKPAKFTTLQPDKKRQNLAIASIS
ncbi:major facilitator superfamily transporter [Wuchereria bancrofti]|uniref:Major facilitator superfamily transporter n=2 Tax=Wuchereria bancrofti TaxID=6293 RepID=J9F2E9_WUCBA|nr:major facilitator superfamily transporter [Wuchereria bancrofti]